MQKDCNNYGNLGAPEMISLKSLRMSRMSTLFAGFQKCLNMFQSINTKSMYSEFYN